jgi:hypothetical protein
LNSGFKTKSEEIQWRRAKILELKSQGLDQREIAQVLQVSPTTITFDLQYLAKKQERLSENIQLSNYLFSSGYLSWQYRTPLNSTGTYHKKHKTTKKRYRLLNTIWTVTSNYGLCCMEEKTTWLDTVNRCHNNSNNIQMTHSLCNLSIM